ncbi:hypothetical protein H4219_005334 [Mycoemilia scoparia]|uniref:LITAF domain-containing protein n=1 Tax=Mycoemilia scoparia TaxID=417184 RepID=A0A9W7ZV13_9FUNG|nr:hypothetical protein H4219_005334 [Mycoemilia scoparia]
MRPSYSTSSLRNTFNNSTSSPTDTYQSRKSYTRRAGLRAFTPLDNTSPVLNGSASIRTSSAASSRYTTTSEEGSQYFYSAASSSFSSLPSVSRRSSLLGDDYDENDSGHYENFKPMDLNSNNNTKHASNSSSIGASGYNAQFNGEMSGVTTTTTTAATASPTAKGNMINGGGNITAKEIGGTQRDNSALLAKRRSTTAGSPRNQSNRGNAPRTTSHDTTATAPQANTEQDYFNGHRVAIIDSGYEDEEKQAYNYGIDDDDDDDVRGIDADDDDDGMSRSNNGLWSSMSMDGGYTDSRAYTESVSYEASSSNASGSNQSSKNNNRSRGNSYHFSHEDRTGNIDAIDSKSSKVNRIIEGYELLGTINCSKNVGRAAPHKPRRSPSMPTPSQHAQYQPGHGHYNAAAHNHSLHDQYLQFQSGTNFESAKSNGGGHFQRHPSSGAVNNNGGHLNGYHKLVPPNNNTMPRSPPSSPIMQENGQGRVVNKTRRRQTTSGRITSNVQNTRQPTSTAQQHPQQKQKLYPGSEYPPNQYLQQQQQERIHYRDQYYQQHPSLTAHHHQHFSKGLSEEDAQAMTEFYDQNGFYPNGHQYIPQPHPRSLRPSATTPVFPNWKVSNPTFANSPPSPPLSNQIVVPDIEDNDSEDEEHRADDIITGPNHGPIVEGPESSYNGNGDSNGHSIDRSDDEDTDISDKEREDGLANGQRPRRTNRVSINIPEDSDVDESQADAVRGGREQQRLRQLNGTATCSPFRRNNNSTTLLPANSTTIYIPGENPNADLLASNYSFVPKSIMCPKCHRYSPIKYENRVAKQWAAVSFLLLFVFTPLFWVPLVNKRCKHVMYVCKYCNRTIRRAPLADAAMVTMDAKELKRKRKAKKKWGEDDMSMGLSSSEYLCSMRGREDSQNPNSLGQINNATNTKAPASLEAGENGGNPDNNTNTNKLSTYALNGIPRKKHQRRRLLSFKF